MPKPSERAQNRKNAFLIVDDEEQNRRFIGRALSVLYPGDDREEADNGLSALDKIRAMAPVIVILDIQLPGLNGIKVCEAVRREPISRSVKILAITGYDIEDSKLQILKAGADDFLGKPFSIQELGARLEKLIARG